MDKVKILLSQESRLKNLKSRYERNDPTLRTKSTGVKFQVKDGSWAFKRMMTIDPEDYAQVCRNLNQVRTFLTRAGIKYC